MTLREQLIRDEGFSLKPYRDTVGRLTIGIGRNLDDRGISIEEADMLLNNDLLLVETGLNALLPQARELDEARRGVLLNMGFNMGLDGLLKFRRMLRAVEIRDYESAAREMLDSDWALQVGSRADRLSKQMTTGTWQ